MSSHGRIESYTPEQASAEILRRKRMRESLVGYAESIAIPGAPVVDDGDEPFELHDGRVVTLNELDDLGSEVESWAREKATIRGVRTEYGHIFQPVGSGMAKHHRILLEKIQATMERRYGRLMVFMPPGSAKSTYATVVAPTWDMGRNPGSQIILASYATPIAKKLGSRGRLICQQDCYQGAFGTDLNPKTTAKESWALLNGSEYMSGGLLSGLTGNRARGVIIDDPVKGRQAAESKVERERTLAAFEDDLTTRMIPGAWMILIQTRWAEEDLAGSILPEDYAGQSGPIMCRDGNVWEVLNIPGKCEHEDDPLGREIGEYLWPEWFDEKFWAMYEPREGDPLSPSPRRWAALFQQRPRADSGNLFEEEMFERYELGQHPGGLNFYGASDYATKEDEGDFTEHGVAGLDSKEHMWIVDWFYGQVETDVGIDQLLRLASKWKFTRGFGEGGLIRHAIEPAFKTAKRQQSVRLAIEYLPNAGKKETRVLSFQALANSGRVHIPRCPWGDRLIEQLVAFPGRSHDDGVDVCSLFGRALLDMRWSQAKVVEQREPGLKFGSWEWLCHGTEEKAPQRPATFTSHRKRHRFNY
jgi:predicted phage terminase large subunit-like protein